MAAARFRIINEEVHRLANFRTRTGLDKHRIMSVYKELIDVGKPEKQ